MAMTRLKVAIAFFLTVAGLAPAQAPERRDGNGDPLPSHALARLGTVRWRHGGDITYVTHTPDGKHLLTDSDDGTLRLWDLETGRETRRFAKPDQGAGADAGGFLVLFHSASYGTALSPSGRVLAAGSANGAITLWDAGNGQVLRTLKADPPTATRLLRFSADNEMLVAQHGNGTHRVWDVRAGTLLRELGKAPTDNGRFVGFGALPGAMMFQADGNVVAAVQLGFRRQGGNRLQRWDLITGRELPPVEIENSANEFLGFAFSPDGMTLAVAGFQGTARLVDTGTGKEVRKLAGLNMFSFVTQYAFSPDGKVLAGRIADQTIHLWDVSTGKELRVLDQPTGPKFMGFIFYSGQTASNLAFSPDGKYLVYGTSGNTVHRWEVETGKQVPSLPGHQAAVLRLARSADGKTVVSYGADRAAHVWEAATGTEIRGFALSSDITVAALSPDGHALVTGSNDGTVRLYDVPTGKEARKWQAGSVGFNTLAFSADGKTLASRGVDHVIRLWDVATGKEKRQMSEKPVMDPLQGNEFLQSLLNGNVPIVAFSADGGTLATIPPVADRRLANFGMREADSAAVRLWDVDTGRLVRKFDDSKRAFTAFAYAPDARTLATADADGSLVLWEAITGKVRLRLKTASLATLLVPLFNELADRRLRSQAAGIVTHFTALAFSPDGRILAGADSKNAIRFWDVVSGELIGSLAGHQGQVQALLWSADGQRLFSGSADTSVLLWDVTPVLKPYRTHYPGLEDGQADGLWQALGGDAPDRVYQAALRLMGAPKQVVPLLRERLRPVQPPDPAKLARLLSDLDSKQFNIRQQATEDLLKLGELAMHPVNQALEGKPSLERRQRLERVRDQLVLAMTLTPEQRQALRSIEVLERIGTPEARAVLRSLAGGATGARVTRHAQAALRRLGE